MGPKSVMEVAMGSTRQAPGTTGVYLSLLLLGAVVIVTVLTGLQHP